MRVGGRETEEEINKKKFISSDPGLSRVCRNLPPVFFPSFSLRPSPFEKMVVCRPVYTNLYVRHGWVCMMQYIGPRQRKRKMKKVGLG